MNRNFFQGLKLNLLQLGLLFFVILGIESCCKDKNPRLEGCQDSVPKDLGFFNLDHLKPYFCFNRGSWWLYECDSTGEIDSVVMINFSLDTIHAESESRYYDYESFTYTLQGSFDQSTTRYYNYGSNPDMENWSFFLKWERSRIAKSDYDGVSTMYSNIFDVGKSFGNGCVYIGHLDELVVLGKTYNDIIVFEVAHDPTWPDTKIPTYDYGKSTYYYANNIGLIKIQNLDIDRSKQAQPIITQSWNLRKQLIIK